jgi:hypothetical protein
MDRPGLEVANLLRRYGEAYREQHSASCPRRSAGVMSAIELGRASTLATTPASFLAAPPARRRPKNALHSASKYSMSN